MTTNKNSDYWKGVKSERKNTLTVAVTTGLVALLIGGAAGFGISTVVNKKAIDPNAQKLIEAYNIIKDEWLFGNDIKDLDSIAVDLMLNGLFDNDGDPYTFYTKDQASQGLDTTGLGFGVSFSNYYGRPIIAKLHNGTFASCGLKKGDIILDFAKNSGTVWRPLEIGYAQTLEKLKGVRGDTFDLTVDRDGETLHFYDVPVGNYSQITVFPVSDTTENGKRRVEIRIDTFLGSPALELRSTLDNLLKKGTIDTLLLDVKDNGGGYVSEMAQIVSYFVPKDTIIYSMKNKKGVEIQKVTQGDNPRYSEAEIKEIRIVQNGNSASASESFTLALQDTGSAEVYGTTSFGKGIAQTFYNFSDGSVIRYTYAYIYGPSGRTIHKTGIVPDYETSQDYYLIKTVPDFSIGENRYNDLLKSQLEYLGFTGELGTMLTELQEKNGLKATGVYDESTFNFLCGYCYDSFWKSYNEENNSILMK